MPTDVPVTTLGDKETGAYWEAQVLLVRILQNSGLKVGVKDRLPLFRLWLLVSNRMTGVRRENILALLQQLIDLRKAGKEPPFKDNKYT